MRSRTENNLNPTSRVKNLPTAEKTAVVEGDWSSAPKPVVPELETLRGSISEFSSVPVQAAVGLPRMEWGHSGMGTAAVAGGDLNLASDTMRAVQNAIAHHALELKQVGAEALAVTFRPDSATELFLHVSRHEGNVVVHVRCEQGNTQELQSQWNQLSSTLADRGIRLAPLNEPPPSSTAAGNPRAFVGDSTPQNSGHFNQGRGSSRRYEESLDDLPMVGSLTEPLRRRAQRSGRGAKRGWESWA